MTNGLAPYLLDEERRTGTYVACHYTPESCQLLADWAESIKVPKPLAKNKFHTTILYSRTELKGVSGILEKNPGWFFAPKKLELFDPRTKEETTKALVFVMEAPELVSLHGSLLAAGGSHDHDGYHPHITLSYAVPPDFNIAGIEMPDIKLEVSDVYAEPLDLNWSKKK